MSDCNDNSPKTRAGNTLYITGLNEHLLLRWLNAPFKKSFQAVVVRKSHRSTSKSTAADFLGEVNTSQTKTLFDGKGKGKGKEKREREKGKES